MIRQMLTLGSLLIYLLLRFKRCKCRRLLPLRLFSRFPCNSNDLLSRHIHNWYAFVFYSNIIIGTRECGYKHAQNSLFSLLNLSFQPIHSFDYRCIHSYFRCCRLKLYVSWRKPFGKYFSFICAHPAIKLKWNV